MKPTRKRFLAALILVAVSWIGFSHFRTSYGAAGGFLYGGSELTADSETYYNKATTALIQKLYERDAYDPNVST